MFYKGVWGGGGGYLINFITKTLFDFVHSREKMGVLGIWEVGEWGGPLFPKVNVKILANF